MDLVGCGLGKGHSWPAQIGSYSVLGVLTQIVIVEAVIPVVKDAPGEVVFRPHNAKIAGVGGAAHHHTSGGIHPGIGVVGKVFNGF